MIEIKFDSNNESIMLSHLKDMFTANPILLQNIVEPCVNGMISDQNVPAQIKEAIKQGVQLTLTPEVIKANFEAALPDIMQEQGVVSSIDRILTDAIESDHGPIHDMIQSSIDDCIDQQVSSNDIRDTISDKIDEHINDRDIESAIEEAVDGADIDRKVETAIRDYVRDVDIENAVNISIAHTVEQNVDAEAIKAIAKSLITDKLATITEFRLLEIIREVAANQPEIKKLIEDQTIPPVLQKVVPTGCDTLIIKCKHEATSSFMWMLKSLVNENTIYIEKVNGI